jgi:CheY-like chemotaxis protein
MIFAGRPAKILLIDTNVYFSKRLSDALKREGFEVTSSTQPAFALTTLEYDSPSAIVCSTNMREMGALDIARLVRADAKNAALPVIALGDGSQRALMEAFQAGCDDYIDRTRPPAVIAAHVKNIIISKAEGFQPTQMLAQADTSLSGSLTHHDLPGVMQMLGHAHQTGALHINSGDTDALLFFDAGSITHAECGALFGDEAVIFILKNCFRNNSGIYKFVYGSASTQRTVLRSATDLMLDAMREVDESCREQETPSLAEVAHPEPVPSPATPIEPLASRATTPESSPADSFVREALSLATTAEAEGQRQTGFPASEQWTDFAATTGSPNTAEDEYWNEPSLLTPLTEESALPDQSNFSAALPENGCETITHSNDYSAAEFVDDSLQLGEAKFLAAATSDAAPASAHSDDFPAIADALDRFAFARSNDNALAMPEDGEAVVPDSRESEGTSNSLEQVTGAFAAEGSAPAPAVENNELPATDDQPVVTRPEEVL